MKTLTTPVPVQNNVANILRWRVLRYVEHDDVTPPWMEVVVQVTGTGGKVYPSPTSSFGLVAVDSGQSLCLTVNPTPLAMTDQITSGLRTLAGTPYTTLAAAAATGTLAARRLAVEAACLSTGLVDAALTGT